VKSEPSTIESAPSRKKSSRNGWLIVLVVFVALLVTGFVLWEQILAQVRSMKPDRLVFAAVAVWAATALAMYLWRLGSLLLVRRTARRSEAKLFNRLARQANAAVADSIELSAVTTEWAVRAELVRDDVEDVQEYMQRLVKRPGIRRALVARADGIVVGSGDRSQRGQALAKLVTGLPAEDSGLQKLPAANDGMLFVIPVMGLESRLGTLVLEIALPVLQRDDRDTGEEPVGAAQQGKLTPPQSSIDARRLDSSDQGLGMAPVGPPPLE
jgi:hypothetical protein